jgi:hypothetical protein
VPMATNQSVGLICSLMMCCNSSTQCLITLAQYVDNVLARERQPMSTAPNESRCIEILAQRAGAERGGASVVAHESTGACGLHIGSRYEFNVLVRRRQPNHTTPHETFVTRAAAQVHKSSSQ